MRTDMDKILVERPRVGHWIDRRCDWKGTKRAFQRAALNDELPVVEKINRESRHGVDQVQGMRQRDCQIGEGVPEAWGDWLQRAINWETMTAITLLESGADIVVLRHPESVKRVKAAIAELMAA